MDVKGSSWNHRCQYKTVHAHTTYCFLSVRCVLLTNPLKTRDKTAFDMHSKSMLIHFQVIMYKKLMKYDCNANILKRYLQNQGMKRDCEQNQKREDFLGDHPVSPVTSRV